VLKHVVMENLGKHLQGGLAFTENDVASHATDIYRPIAQEVSLKDAVTIYIRPLSLNDEGPYQFPIHSRGNAYIQTNQIRLWMQAKVTMEDGTAIAKADGVGVCNLFGNSMFPTIDIDIGGKTITELQTTHANYKSYLETLLSFSPQHGTGPLAASMWHLDEATHFEDVKFHDQEEKGEAIHENNSKNDGFRGRRKIVGVSRTFDLVIPLHSDFLNCDRLLPPIPMMLSLTRAKDSFVLMHPAATGKSFKVQILSLKLAVPYITVASDIVAHHQTLSAKQPILLPIKKSDIFIQHAGAGAQLFQMTNLFPNRLPKSLIIGMVSTTAYSGSGVTNPYNFKHFGVNYVSISRNGVMIPTEPYTPDWDNKLFAREYRAFFDNIGIGTDNIGSLINPKLYGNGCTLFAWDFSPDKCGGYHWHKREEGGSIDIDFRFKDPLPAGGVTFLLFGISDALVAIDQADNVAVSY